MPAVPSLTDEERTALIETAALYKEIPYEWGGQSFWYESSPSVDCSGYVINVYKEVLEENGKRFPFEDETVYGIWSRYSEPTDSPLMGDLVFFTDGEGDEPVHIGIFVRKEGSALWFWDASSLPDTMRVMLRCYDESNAKILGFGRMMVLSEAKKSLTTLVRL